MSRACRAPPIPSKKLNTPKRISHALIPHGGSDTATFLPSAVSPAEIQTPHPRSEASETLTTGSNGTRKSAKRNGDDAHATKSSAQTPSGTATSHGPRVSHHHRRSKQPEVARQTC